MKRCDNILNSSFDVRGVAQNTVGADRNSVEKSINWMGLEPPDAISSGIDSLPFPPVSPNTKRRSPAVTNLYNAAFPDEAQLTPDS
jgi:hypothetical protein